MYVFSWINPFWWGPLGLLSGPLYRIKLLAMVFLWTLTNTDSTAKRIIHACLQLFKSVVGPAGPFSATVWEHLFSWSYTQGLMVTSCSHEGNGQWNVLLPGPILYSGPRGTQIRGPKMGLFSWRHTWIILFAMNSIYIRAHKNTIASNFILYRGPDSRPKGPHQNGFIQLKTYMENSFCNGICIHWRP